MARRVQKLTVEMRGTRSGFTLVELMIVVAIIGILAALGVYGLRRYQQYASTGEATAMLQGMRGAQENFKAETLAYGGCNVGGLTVAGAALGPPDMYPRAPLALTNQKMSFDPAAATALSRCFRTIGVRSDGPVRFTYGMIAGAPGVAIPGQPGPQNLATPIPAVAAPAEPWYVLVAVGNRDNDAVYALMLTISQNNHIYMENETE